MRDFKLGPCPFCGGEVTDLGYEGRGPYITKIKLLCKECRYVMELSKGDLTMIRVDVVEIWNRRPEK